MTSPLRRSAAQIRVRVTAAALLAALVTAALGSALFVSQLRSGLERDLLATSRQQVSALVARLQAGESASQAVLSGKNDIVIQLVVDGEVVASDHPLVTRPLLARPGEDRHVRVSGLEDEYVVTARREGRYLVVVGESSEGVGKATGETITLLVSAVPLGVLLLVATVWVSVGRALRPVEGMRRAADAITAAHQARRLDVPAGGDELARLAVTLNQMLDRIDATQHRQRQFVADASHELRSPLSALRQLAEVARDYGAEPGDLARDVLAEEQRMEQLVEALLVLARLDDGALNPQPAAVEPVDLDDVVLLEARRSRTPDGPRVDVSAVGAGQVRGDPVLLAQVVHNLVANAVRHAHAEVRVGLSEADGFATLVVDDDGAGVPVADRERVFERFVRLDESRTRDSGGTGLGLAIVHEVVTGLHGTVAVEDAPGGGARFVVRLPVA